MSKTTYKIKGSANTITLGQDQFVAQGGEGSIYVVDDMVYKICDPGKMIPEAKIQELKMLDRPRIICPKNVILLKNVPVGYTMQRVPINAKPLAQMLTKDYCERESFTPDLKRGIVNKIHEELAIIHKHPKYLQVDGNEWNYMSTEKHDDIFFIDVNSFQTPSYPADAIMPSIRDWHCLLDPKTNMYQWSALTDWFSFGIISFYIFVGIHPFKGWHPSFPNQKTKMVDQMKACKSVLDKEVDFPQGAVYYPFEDFIPGGKDGAYMQWYRTIFTSSKRLPAPDSFQAMMTIVTKIKEITGSDKFAINMLRDYLSTIIGFVEQNGHEIVITKEFIYLDSVQKQRPADRFRIGFTPGDRPIVLYLDGEDIQILDLNNGSKIDINLQGKNFMSCEGRLYVQGERHIFEITFMEKGGVFLCLPKLVASIMPNATTLFQGVAFQDFFGKKMVSIFPKTGSHCQPEIPELNTYRIVDAKYERGVLMVLGYKDNQYDRFVIRFSDDFTATSIRKIENVINTGLNFTVLANGICVCLTEEEKIEVFSSSMHSHDVKSIDDPIIKADMRLCSTSNRHVRFAQGSRLYNIAVK